MKNVSIGLTPRILKRWAFIHKWSSLICTGFILLLCLTGLPLIFADEIDHALGYRISPPPWPDSAIPPRANLDAVIAAAQARRPGDSVQFLVAEPQEPDVWFVRMGADIAAAQPSAFYSMDARTGAYLQAYPLNQGLMNIALRLHVDLFAGLWGSLWLGLMGVFLMVAIVSGVVLYAPFMRKLTFGTVRQGYLAWLDWHNLLGIVTVVWLSVVTVTGVINTVAAPIFSRWQSEQLAQLLAPYAAAPIRPIGSVQTAVNAAYRAVPNSALSFLAFPGNPFAGPNQFVAFMQGDTPLTAKLLKPVVLDAQTGEVLATAELPGYVSALLLSKPLHFGDYGGLPLKILWAMLDLLSIGILVGGLYLWGKKHRRRPAQTAKPQRQLHPIRPKPWPIPIAICASSLIGLCAALLADGLGDTLSWLALSVPIIALFARRIV